MMANFSQKRLLSGICFCLFVAGTSLLPSTSLLNSEEPRIDANSKSGKDTQKLTQQPKNRELNIQNEQLAQELAREHLPQLMPVLKQLKTDQPRQYERAVWDLSRSAKRLKAAQKRDEQFFEVELKLLKAETDANLLAARLKVRDNSQDREKLRDAVARLLSAKQTKIQYEIDSLQKRIARDQASLATAEQRLSDFEEDANNTVSASYLSMLRKAGRKLNASEPKKKRQKTVTTSSDR